MSDLTQYVTARTKSEPFPFAVHIQDKVITNIYTSNLAVWSLSSIKEDLEGSEENTPSSYQEDYYLVTFEGVFASSNGYLLDNDTERGLYAVEYTVEIIPELVPPIGQAWDSSQASIILVESSPATTSGQTSVTVSTSQSFGANVGFFGDIPTGGISGSLDFSMSKTVPIQDVTVTNLSGTDPKGNAAKWKYTMPQVDMDRTKCQHLIDPEFVLNDPVLMSRATFNPYQYIYWKVTERNQQAYQSLNLTCNLTVKLNTTSLIATGKEKIVGIATAFGLAPGAIALAAEGGCCSFYEPSHVSQEQNFKFTMPVPCPPPSKR